MLYRLIYVSKQPRTIHYEGGKHMSKKGIFAISPDKMERRDYADAMSLATEICDSVRKSGVAATIRTDLKWWANATTSPWVGPVNNWSIGYPEKIGTDDLFGAIEAKGLFVSFYDGYPEFAIVDKVEHDHFPGVNCFLPGD